MENKRKIGVLGGGFGGLYAVSCISRHLGRRVDVTLFDRNNYLLYTPVLHEMATGTVNARHIVIPIRQIIDPRKVHIRCEEVTSVDLAEKAMETASGRFLFDFLILSPGSISNFYSIPGAEKNAITFKSIEDAIQLRNRLIGALERGAIERDPEKKKKQLTIVVAGGGCTGVEVAAEMAQFIQIILHRDYPEIKRSEVRILLVEAMDRILPSFPEYLSGIALVRLRKMGVEVLLDKQIQKVEEELIELRNKEEIPYGIFVWAGGIKASSLTLKPEVKRDRVNRIVVNERLEIENHPGVYMIGDGAHFSRNGNPLPSTASVAVQEARHVARSLQLRLKNREVPAFRFHYRGDMASLGFMSGVAEIYGRRLKGFPAWVMWKAFKLAMLPRYKTRAQIIADWMITLLFKRDTSKLT